jgi:hypothetical protein
MKTQKLAAMLLTLALSLGASQAALATCDVDGTLTALSDTIALAYFANDRDERKLKGKVEAARDKLDDGKPYDAKDKLADIKYKIDNLLGNTRKQKIDPSDGADILRDVATASDCIDVHINDYF